MKKLPPDWSAALTRTKQKRISAVPPGWVTVEQFAAMLDGSSLTHARLVLSHLIAAGEARRDKFRVEVTPGLVRPVYHYRLKK